MEEQVDGEEEGGKGLNKTKMCTQYTALSNLKCLEHTWLITGTLELMNKKYNNLTFNLKI